MQGDDGGEENWKVRLDTGARATHDCVDVVEHELRVSRSRFDAVMPRAGRRVLVRVGARWLNATVRAARPRVVLFDVDFDEGGGEASVEPRRIRLVEQQGGGSADGSSKEPGASLDTLVLSAAVAVERFTGREKARAVIAAPEAVATRRRPQLEQPATSSNRVSDAPL